MAKANLRSSRNPAEASPASSAAPQPWRRRWMVIAVAIVLLLILLATISGPSWSIVLDRLFSDGSVLLAWLVSAAGFGTLLRIRAEDDESSRPLTIVTTIAAGIGILSLLQLLLGLAGQLHRVIAIALVAVGIALLLWRARRISREDVTRWLTAPADAEWLWLLAVPALAIVLVAAFAPPGILWGDEPHGYDVLEYHLQLPREWYELGRIVPLHHNVITYFPHNVEMQNQQAMQLKGGSRAGMYLAQLMHVAMTALSVAAVYATARLFASKWLAILVAVAMANVPWTMLLAPVAYNEGGVLLFGTLAIAWVLRESIPALRRAAPRGAAQRSAGTHCSSAFIAGVMTGFACGSKLPSVPLLLIPLPIILLAATRSVRSAIVLSLTALLTFSPWLIRNVIWAGNPVFPEAQHMLGHAHFSPAQTQRWNEANHQAKSPRLSALRDQIFLNWRFGYVIIPLGMLAVLLTIRRREAQILLALLLAWLIFWIALTHLQGRFYTSAAPLAAIGIALLQQRWQRYLAAAVALSITIIGLALTAGVFAEKVSPLCSAQVLGIESFKGILPQDVEDAIAATSGPIALVGDARAFLYQVPTSRLRYRTVFDVDVQADQSILAAWLGNQEGSPLVIVDPMELERFSRTYFGIPPLGSDVPGPRDRVFMLAPSAGLAQGVR